MNQNVYTSSSSQQTQKQNNKFVTYMLQKDGRFLISVLLGVRQNGSTGAEICGDLSEPTCQQWISEQCVEEKKVTAEEDRG